MTGGLGLGLSELSLSSGKRGATGGGGGSPVLSAASTTITGSTTASLAVTTDQANGTLYWVVDTSGTPPSAAQVKAGQGSGGGAAAASGNQAVTVSGAQAASATGLTASTAYFSYYMHENASAQQSNVAAAVSATTWNSQTQTWVTAVVGDGGSVTTARGQLVDNVITSLKSASIFTKMDRLWLFAAENSQSSLRDIIAASAASLVNAPTFTANQGYTGNGTSNYINSNFTPSTAGGNYALNSASFGAYDLTNSTTQEDRKIAGNATVASTVFDFIIPRFTDGKAYAEINAAATNANANSANHQAFWSMSRTSSSQVDFYRNGSSFAANAASTSIALSDQTFVFLARRTNAAVNGFSTDQLSAAYLSGGLNSTEAGALSTAVNTYMTALGINVY